MNTSLAVKTFTLKHLIFYFFLIHNVVMLIKRLMTNYSNTLINADYFPHPLCLPVKLHLVATSDLQIEQLTRLLRKV